LLQQPANYREHVVAQLQPVGEPDVEPFDRVASFHDVGAAQDAAEPFAEVFLPTFAFHTQFHQLIHSPNLFLIKCLIGIIVVL